MENEMRKRIFELVDEDYRKFQSSLIPNCENMLGVRIPQLRNIAKEIAKGDWQDFLNNISDDYFEEVMLQGMVIGYIKIDARERLKFIESFVPKINNWSICDSFCVGLKFTKKNLSTVWDFLIPYFESEKEYEVRFGIVMLLNYYVEKEYIENILRVFNEVKHEGYYVKMAVAWAISKCFIKFPEKTMKFFFANDLDDFTFNKALQKITESHLIDHETKTIIRNMKRKVAK